MKRWSAENWADELELRLLDAGVFAPSDELFQTRMRDIVINLIKEAMQQAAESDVL
jgi:hypothetical protein